MNRPLHHGVTDITGTTGMKTIREALMGNDRPEPRFALTQAVERYDVYPAQVAHGDPRIEQTLFHLQRDGEPPVEPLPAPRHKTRQPNDFAFDVRAAL